jgi:hypothetical protein
MVLAVRQTDVADILAAIPDARVIGEVEPADGDRRVTIEGTRFGTVS